MAKIIVSIATLGFVGHLPASGTVATCVVLPLVCIFSFLSFSYQVFIALILHGVGLFIIDKALSDFSQSDPKQIVFDELVGTFITFIGIAYDPVVFLIGFFLFRLFDIFKPFGIKYVEKLPGGWGVLLDDSVAGLFANFVLRFLFI